jgi:hypothetical protein
MGPYSYPLYESLDSIIPALLSVGLIIVIVYFVSYSLFFIFYFFIFIFSLQFLFLLFFLYFFFIIFFFLLLREYCGDQATQDRNTFVGPCFWGLSDFFSPSFSFLFLFSFFFFWKTFIYICIYLHLIGVVNSVYGRGSQIIPPIIKTGVSL